MEQTRRQFLKEMALVGSSAFLFEHFPGLLRTATSQEISEFEKEKSGYTYCDGCNHVPKCGIVYYRRGHVITRLESRRDYNYPNSILCSKGYAQLQEQYHPSRLRYPLKRTAPKGKSPKWVRISWKEALDTIGKKLNDIKEKYGAHTVCFYCGDPKEMRPIVQRLAFSFGSPNYGTESSTCFRSVSLASLLLFGEITTGSPPSKQTKNCFIWGVNPSYSGPYAMRGLLKAKADGVKFFIIDPRKTPTVQLLADRHLAIRPGTDGALALAMMNVIISEDLYDKEFVNKWVHGFEELKEYVKEFPPEKAEKITGVAREKIIEAAKAFADGPSTLMVSAAPVVHHTNGNQNMRAVLSLIAITGNFDRPGGVMIPPPAAIPPDFLGDADFCRRTDLLPKISHLRVDLEEYPAWVELIPEIQMNLLPEYVDKGKIKAIVMFGGNAKMWPQPKLYQEALGKMEFGVAADYFYRPWTHDYIDILLPAATCFERLAALACFGRNIYMRQPIKPLGEAREDWQIAADIGVALGLKQEFFNGNLEALLNEYIKKTGFNIDQIKNAPGCMINVPLAEPPKAKKYELGLLRRDKKPGFNTPTGKIEIYSTILKKYGYDPIPTYKEPIESPQGSPEMAKEYPLVLMTGARIPFYTHSKWREVPWVSELQPEPTVNLNPEDAKNRGIKEGDYVLIKNPHGQIKVRAHLTEMVMQGVVDMFHGWPKQDVNTMVPRYLDHISGYPPFKSTLCEVVKA